MTPFIFLFLFDAVSEDNNLPWYVHALVLALGSTELFANRFFSKKK